jgi:anti-anti-sigma factor
MYAEPVRDPGHPGPDLLSIDVDGDDRILERRVTVAGEIDMLSAMTLHETITDMLSRRPRRIEIVLRDVTFLDSAGIRTLLMCHTDAMRAECALALVEPHPRVYRVLQITGLLDHFHLTAEPAPGDRSTHPG